MFSQKIKNHCKVLLTVLLITYNSYAQKQKITPFNNPIDQHLVKESTSAMNWFMLRDTLKFKIGKVTTKIEKDQKNIRIVTTVDVERSEVKWTDTTIVTASSLKPVYHSSFNQQRDIVLNFNDEISGYYLDKNTKDKRIISERPTEPYFDSNVYPHLIRWLPLKENYTAEISIFDYNPKAKIGVMNARVKNVTNEIITIGNEERKVWKIIATDDISDNKMISTYYIDVKTREVLRQQIRIGDQQMLMELAN